MVFQDECGPCLEHIAVIGAKEISEGTLALTHAQAGHEPPGPSDSVASMHREHESTSGVPSTTRGVGSYRRDLPVGERGRPPNAHDESKFALVFTFSFYVVVVGLSDFFTSCAHPFD